MKIGKKSRFFLLLFLSALLLCGCGKEKKGDSYLKEGKYEEAIQVYEGELSDKDSKSAQKKNLRLFSRMGEAYCYLEDYEKALECFNEAEALAGEDGLEKELYLYRGLCFEKLSSYPEASEDYEAYFAGFSEKESSRTELSEEEKSVQVFAYNELGLCYMKQEEYEKALTALEAGLSLKPEKEKEKHLLRNKIVALEYLSRFEEAYAECTEYLSQYPEDEDFRRECDFLETRID